MIKMCVFDVDGTLYDYYNQKVLESTIEALKKLQEQGIKVVIATGRVHYGLGKALNDLHVDYVCAVNGSVIADKEGKILYRRDFTLSDVEELLAFAKQWEAGLTFKFIDHVYIYQHPEKIDWYSKQLQSDIGSEPFVLHPQKNHHLTELPQSASIHAPYKEVELRFGKSETLEFLPYSENGFDVVAKGINKGVGIEKLMQILGLCHDEVMVFGDNYNDLPMFEKADWRVAMGNAVTEVKKQATYITDDCSKDGIYHACKFYHLI